MKQTTLKHEFTIEGIGLHTGQKISMTVHPAFADSGICFRRSDVASEYTRVTPYAVTSTMLATTIKCGEHSVSTIEHIMSALYGMGVDNAMIEVSGPEVPILDGSAKPFIPMIAAAGLKELGKPRKYLKFNKKVRLEKDGKWVEIIPSRFFKVTFDIDFESDSIGQQRAFFQVDEHSFADEIAGARTFGFKQEVESLWQMGLAKGGSLENAVVIDGDYIMNPEGLRFSDEFVRHKVLDLIGDISLTGYRIFGHIRAYKSGHQMNNLFARLLLESKDSYSIIEVPDERHSGLTQLELKPQGMV
ncbi:UDP-3-O-acyl-N-acetylglucosamine deacetylase [Seleniivibrio sp.]|nr:UDP-3-O-acyl-N-acetylglucosamine deacetylase [Seleniivibrio sp.]MCD8554309.1 UDP-3-O-acyl-N-acetylglucosamine deacetylase [Seleniivibrio sp.]